MTCQPKKPTKNSQNLLRTLVTAKIWGFATGMLAICIPLARATNSGVILPIMIIFGATISTASVWQFSNQKEKLAKVKELEARIADLETIICRVDRDW